MYTHTHYTYIYMVQVAEQMTTAEEAGLVPDTIGAQDKDEARQRTNGASVLPSATIFWGCKQNTHNPLMIPAKGDPYPDHFLIHVAHTPPNGWSSP